MTDSTNGPASGPEFHWTGWLRRRRGDPWVRACAAATLDACARELARLGDEQNIPAAGRVMTGGGSPRLPQDAPAGAEGNRRPFRRRF
jgi:hypothetical protein